MGRYVGAVAVDTALAGQSRGMLASLDGAACLARNTVVVDPSDRERERLEGALHDGVQQDLVGASVALQLALRLLDTDPAAARALLAELEEQVVDALERVRALPEDLYPRCAPGEDR